MSLYEFRAYTCIHSYINMGMFTCPKQGATRGGERSPKCLSKAVDHILRKVFDVPEATSNYFTASLLPCPHSALFVLLSVYTVIKNLIIDPTELL